MKPKVSVQKYANNHLLTLKLKRYTTICQNLLWNEQYCIVFNSKFSLVPSFFSLSIVVVATVVAVLLSMYRRRGRRHIVFISTSILARI